MKLGIIMFPTEEAVAPSELGRLLEDRGFESLFLPDHTQSRLSLDPPVILGPLDG